MTSNQQLHQHILSVFFLAPGQGTGSSIVVDRHLKRLESKGCKISIAVPEQKLIGTNFPNSWQVIPLPMRQWWWPPYRPQIPGLLELRLRCWQLECERVLQGKRPTAILTVLWDLYPLFATLLSKNWKIPMSVIIHDQQELWAKSEAERRLIKRCSKSTLNQAARVWPVSQELGDAYQIKEASKVTTLLPISEGNSQMFVEWKDSFKSHPVIAHAGSLHPFQISNLQSIASALQKINGTLLLITSANNAVLENLLKNYSNIKHQDLFEKNTDVIKFLADNASCILVSYSFNVVQQPWALNSFPSKLVEFTHLGLPILILAPLNTAISNWAKRNQWLSYLSQVNEKELVIVLNKLTIKETWLQMAEQSRCSALNEFNSNLIQTQFEKELFTIK